MIDNTVSRRMFIGGGVAAAGMLWLDLIKNSGANIDWLVEQGVEYEPVVDEYRIMQFSGAYKVAHWYKDGYAGSGYVPQMTERIEGLDIDVFTNTRAYEFVCDESGKVAGVLCSDVNGETVQVNAHVFIVATGSFAQNEELLEEEGFRPAEIDILAMPGHFGDGIRMVQAVGGTFFKGGTALIYNRIGQLWTFADLNGSICSGGPFLWVNEEGLRYTDENIALEKKLCPLEAVQTQIHKSCYTVFDANIFSQVTGGDEGLSRMLVVDHIVANFDRHWGNFGVIVEAETRQWVGLAPIYDTGENLWCDRALANDFRPYTKALYPMPVSTDISSQLERYAEDLGWLDPAALDGFADEAVDLLAQNREVAAMPGRLEGIRAALERTVQDVLRVRG